MVHIRLSDLVEVVETIMDIKQRKGIMKMTPCYPSPQEDNISQILFADYEELSTEWLFAKPSLVLGNGFVLVFPQRGKSS